MKRNYSLARWAACSFLALTVLTELRTAHAQGTAFTYQGRLNDGANPANGNYDLTFSMFDADTGGNLVGNTLTNTAVGVSNGLFTVTLDPGAGIFDGTSRWLEIGVSTNGADSFVTLTPRQALTPAPYAIYAASAATVAAGSVASGQLSTPVAPTDGQVLAYTGGSLQWADPATGSSLWSPSGTDIYYNAGNVGIGTTTPQHRLAIVGGPVWTGNGWSGALSLDNGSAIAWKANPAGQRFGMGHTGGGFGLFRTGSDPGTSGSPALYDFWLDDAGRLGLGTTVPQAKLHLFDPASSITQVIETGGGINAWAKVRFKNLNGQWDIGTSRGFNNDVFYIDRLGTDPLEFQFAANGFLGLGLEPQAKLHMYEPVDSVTQVIETGGGINAWSQLRFRNADGEWVMGTSRGYNGDQLYFSHPGGANPAFAVQPNGDAFIARNLSTCSLTIRGGCDLAEPFAMNEHEIEKGSVVVIDKAHPGQLKLSTEAYDKRVAGIVSGANGINPGIALHQEGAFEGGQNVALSGRVYVRADAAYGAIEPGDLLTTSDMPGCAMKVTDHARAQGAIVGKAMSGLAAGKGMVLVLVSLQ